MNPKIPQLEQALDFLITSIYEMMQNGEEISDEIANQLADEIEGTIQKITDLKANEGDINAIEQEQAQVSEQVASQGEGGGGAPHTGGNIPPLEEGMPSSNIDSFNYDPKTGRLFVRFLGDFPNRNGSTYAYQGVPREIFELFRKGAVPARTNGQNKWGKWWKGKNPSIGSSLYTLIKSANYPYKKVS